MTKSKKQRQNSVNKDHDKKNMVILGLTVAAVLVFILATM